MSSEDFAYRVYTGDEPIGEIIYETSQPNPPAFQAMIDELVAHQEAGA